MKSLFRIYSQRLAGYLMLNGFPLLKISEDRQSGKNHFIFANNDELRECVDKWVSEKRNSQLQRKQEYNK